jgi:flagellin-like hook-associated protein FlgL
MAFVWGFGFVAQNAGFALGPPEDRVDYLGNPRRINAYLYNVLSSAGGAHRVCIGDEIYFIGSATLGHTSNDARKGALAIDLRSAIAAEGSPFAAGRNWADITAISAVAFAINNNPNSEFWARVETHQYRTDGYAGYASLYVFAKEGGPKTHVQACDEQMGDIRGDKSQYHKIEWYNDETESSNDAGTYFNNGGKDWGTLRAVPTGFSTMTGFGTWGVQLHGQDVGRYRDLWILNVGAYNADINTDPRTAYTGLGFGATYGNGGFTGITNMLGLDRASFVEIQNAENGKWAGAHVRTQSDAQEALDAIQGAIERKDKIRANLGAYINRLDNTITNLEIQAENLQASESRISDVDLATEMTEFVRNQVLTQAAVSMLSQANSLPQMALSLLNG